MSKGQQPTTRNGETVVPVTVLCDRLLRNCYKGEEKKGIGLGRPGLRWRATSNPSSDFSLTRCMLTARLLRANSRPPQAIGNIVIAGQQRSIGGLGGGESLWWVGNFIPQIQNRRHQKR